MTTGTSLTGSKTTENYTNIYGAVLGTNVGGNWVERTWTGGDALPVTRPRRDIIVPGSLSPKLIKPKPTVKLPYAEFKALVAKNAAADAKAKTEGQIRQAYYKKLRAMSRSLGPVGDLNERHGFRRRARRPGLADQNYTVQYNAYARPRGLLRNVRTVVSSGAYYDEARVNNGTFREWGTIPSLPPELNLPPDKAYGLVNSVYTQVKGSGFNAAVFLGEAHRSLTMIGDTAITLAKAAHYFRKGNVKAALNLMARQHVVNGFAIDRPVPKKRSGRPSSALHAKYGTFKKGDQGYIGDAASHTLQIQYGVRPLLQDVKSAAELLSNQLTVTPKKVFKSSCTVRKDYPAYSYNYPAAPGVQHPRAKEAWSTVKRMAKFTLAEQPTVLEMTGLLDPELVLWELTPFSFVADWFLPIGAYLEARAAKSKLIGSWTVTTVWDRGYSEMGMLGSFIDPSQPALRNTITHQVKGSERVTRLVRTVGPAPDVKLPSFKPLSEALSWQHCLNGLALISQIATSPGRLRVI